ncbi:DUF6875 domain-containing protein [Nocardia cyriacigeorgica]|uniref:DUF6875 domain-containing protein n=1 Tax=Nocardia cyriacigeorgica TaxID=135487 RepID=UPI0018951FD7|nr:hypothetical protein [Nocardia cyriacigeorgica]MBF6414021.1 hypothetical protein [Nocardia cyriacigeorgica]
MSTTTDADTVTVLREWLTDYIARPHPELGRSGAICPFVEPSLKRGGIVWRIADWPAGADAAELERLLDDALTTFPELAATETNPALLALVLAIPGLPPSDWHLIDLVHRRIKDRAVAAGLMVGQFHPYCPAPAVHNPRFPVNRAPMPLFAVRTMALHDILFLQAEPGWVRAYQQRYGHRYHMGRVRDPNLLAAYTTASEYVAGRTPRTTICTGPSPKPSMTDTTR